MKNWKAILSTALILGYILLCVFTIPYFITATLHFRGEIYEITEQDGYTIYTCKDKTITVTSGDRIEVTFRTGGALTAQYTVQKNGDAVTVFDENGHFRGEIYEITKQDGYTVYTCKDKTITVTSGDRIEVTFRTDGALTAQYTVQKNGDAVTVFDENGSSVLSGIWKRGALYGEHDTLDSTYQETAAVKNREFLPFPAEALSVAMGAGLGPRGWQSFPACGSAARCMANTILWTARTKKPPRSKTANFSPSLPRRFRSPWEPDSDRAAGTGSSSCHSESVSWQSAGIILARCLPLNVTSCINMAWAAMSRAMWSAISKNETTRPKQFFAPGGFAFTLLFSGYRAVLPAGRSEG